MSKTSKKENESMSKVAEENRKLFTEYVKNLKRKKDYLRWLDSYHESDGFYDINDPNECRRKIEKLDKEGRFKNPSAKKVKYALKKYCKLLEEREKMDGKENVHYLSVLKFLEENGGVEYSDPNNSEKFENKEEQERCRTLREKCKEAEGNLGKLAELCEKKFKLKKDGRVDCLKVLRTEIKNYLWVQLKKNEYKKSPISISIFAEKTKKTNHARFRVSLEIKNKIKKEYVPKTDWEKYYKHLDKKISNDCSLVYVSGSNELENIEDLGKNLSKDVIDNAKLKISDEDGRNENKIQICKIIECNDKTTDDEIVDEIFNGIKELIPYYEYVLGITDTAEEHESSNEETNTKTSEFDKNIILYGPPGTGKTYNTVNYAVAICNGESFDDVCSRKYDEVFVEYNQLKSKGRIEFITFHQSYGYEEFIQGIKPDVENGQVVYNVKSGIFKEFCENAESDDEPYVFIIDEINRGNISKIFGELITLIEEDKRTDKKDKDVGLRVKLPYMKENEEPCGVPNNVYIIGTMNTADRSIALMDTALRRRFQFIEMMPDAMILKDIEIKDIKGKDTNIDLVKMLNTMNERIEILYDREHTIGQGYFTSLKKDNSINELGNIFKKKIIPLLQEYFYDDYENISKVLGDDNATEVKNKFIKSMEKSEDIGNDDFDKIYRKNEECDFFDEETYKKIYEEKDENLDD